jgi:hypothetical protein
MRQTFYAIVRDLHLYAGLFLSPFILVFAISVFFLVHSWVPGTGRAPATNRIENISIPVGFEQLKGREQVEAAHTVLESIGVRGEIGFVRQFPRERRFVFPVSVPGRETMVDINVEKRSAEISARPTGTWDALVYLHKMPGPHNVSIRGNSTFMHAWRWLADATVYLLMFLSMSGVYLWTVIRSERRVGVALLAAGAVSFGGLVYAVIA